LEASPEITGDMDDADYDRISESMRRAFASFLRDRNDVTLGEYGAWLVSVRAMFACMNEFWDQKGGRDGADRV
jgi:Flp pilus assembly pilin Flp